MLQLICGIDRSRSRFFPLYICEVEGGFQVFDGGQALAAAWSSIILAPSWGGGYQSVGHLVPGRTERINNLHYFRFIYYLSPERCFILKNDQILSVTSVYDARKSRRLSRSRDTLPLKAGP